MKYLLACCLVLSTFAYAKKKPVVFAPLSAGLINAKSVYILNKTGSQEVADIAYQQFQQWGRFSLASSAASADLIVTFTHSDRLIDGTSLGQTQMLVFTKADRDNAAFQTTEDFKARIHGHSSTKSCIDDFRKRIDASEVK